MRQLVRKSVNHLPLVCLALLPSYAQGALVFNLSQLNGDVVLSGSGAVDTTGLSVSGPAAAFVPKVKADEFFAVGDPISNLFYTAPRSGPTTIGMGTFETIATSLSGDFIGIAFSGKDPSVTIALPDGYNSGTVLFGTATFAGQSLASMGVTPGDYSWMADTNSIRLTVVPEPNGVVTMGVFAIVTVLRRRATSPNPPRGDLHRDRFAIARRTIELFAKAPTVPTQSGFSFACLRWAIRSQLGELADCRTALRAVYVQTQVEQLRGTVMDSVPVDLLYADKLCLGRTPVNIDNGCGASCAVR